MYILLKLYICLFIHSLLDINYFTFELQPISPILTVTH